MRSRLIHAYDNADYDVLWDIVVLDIPPLVRQLELILAEPENSSFPSPET